jgi:hypothetical protein
VRTLHLKQRADTLVIGDVGNVTEIRIDPNHHFLIQRKWGQVVRFELPVSVLPGAQAVQLSATFLRQGESLPATRDGDTWFVEVPLTDGRYTWLWSVAGQTGASGGGNADPALTGTRVVLPLQRMRDAYPGR